MVLSRSFLVKYGLKISLKNIISIEEKKQPSYNRGTYTTLVLTENTRQHRFDDKLSKKQLHYVLNMLKQLVQESKHKEAATKPVG